MKTLSVVIPTLNEAGYIGTLLTSICAQTEIPDEVIVVDGASSDGTVKIAESFRKHLPLRVMQAPRGTSRQRNTGGRAATGELIVFLDADVELDPSFLAAARREFISRRLDTACSYFHAPSTSPALDRAGAWLISRYHGLFQFSANPMCSGFCVVTTAALFKKLKGFNEAFHHSEDHDYACRAVHSGARFRMLHAPYRLSTRRYEQQGRLKLFSLYTWTEINRIFFNYRFLPRDKSLYKAGIFSPKR